MDEYPNVNRLKKPLKIQSIDSQKMMLDDNSKWQFLDATPPPSTWQVDDEIVIEKTGRFPSNYRVINKSRGKQDRPAVYLGGCISEEEIIKINKSLGGSKKYPSERLDRYWRIKKLLEDACIELEDGSVWQLTDLANKNIGEWEMGQNIRLSKGSSELDFYYMENLAINKTSFIVKFLGFQQIK